MMTKKFILKSLLLVCILACNSFTNNYAGEFPRILTAYLGTTPVLDGFISEGEYSDAEFFTGVNGWFSDTDNGTACADSSDLSVKVWYKHDGSYLYFAFDVTDNLIYGIDTERWFPAANPDANDLTMGVGWPWFGDGLEIMMNSSYTWDDTKKSIGDGTIWQTIVSTHKSTAGGLVSGGLIEGVPYTEYAWSNYRNWYANEHMKAKVRIKSKEEGSGYVVEWRISPFPCMQIDAEHFVDLSKENKVGINFEFEDLDNKEDGLGTKNLTEFRHVDYMAKVEPYRKNIAKSFATLLLSPNKMNPDSSSNSISENYEASLELPASHSLYLGTANTIEVQASGDCGNNKLVISDPDASLSGTAQAIVLFSEIDQTVYTSFDFTPGQVGSSIQFDLMSEREPVVKISFENDKIYYYQNGTGTAWKSYTRDSTYRVQIVADNQSKKYVLNVNGEIIEDLDFHSSSGAAINEFRIFSLAASVGIFEFDNLIIQNDPIETSDFFNIDDCWVLGYDFEESDNVPLSYIVTAENATDVSVNHSSVCDNNALLLIDSSSTSSTMLEVPFQPVIGIVHVQFTVNADQHFPAIEFDLKEADISLVKVALNRNGKISYYQNETAVDWLSYNANEKYSFQIIANIDTKEYTFIVNSDSVKNISFYDGNAGSIDNLTISSAISSLGDVRIDNLLVSNHILSDLVFPFNDCVEFIIDGAKTLTIAGQVNIYPNPSNGWIAIELAAPHPNPIIVTDLIGREIYRVINTMGSRFEMNLGKIESGIYLINFDNDEGHFNRLIQLIK